MTLIPWVQYTEAVVARGHPTLADVTNRPLRDILTQTGHNPDDVSFAGLHHFPLGLFTNSIAPQSGSTVTISAATTVITGTLSIASLVIGTDPGGSELLRIGGGLRFTTTVYGAGSRPTIDLDHTGAVGFAGGIAFRQSSVNKMELFYDSSNDGLIVWDTTAGTHRALLYRTGRVDFPTGPIVVGADPGGSELVRIAGATRQTSTSFVALGTITADTQLFSGTVTWNNAAVIFSGWKLNVVNTASNPVSRALEVQGGGITFFALGNPFAINSPLVTIQQTNPARQELLSLIGAWDTVTPSNLMTIDQGTANASDSSVFILMRSEGGVAHSFAKRSVGLAGGPITDTFVRIGGGNATEFPTGFTSATSLKVGARFNTAQTGAATLIEVSGSAAVGGTWTTSDVYGMRMLTFVKGTSQTITRWYGIKIEAAPVAGTAWAFYCEDDVRIGGDLVVVGSLSGGTLLYNLDSLTDVVITAGATGDFIRWNGSNWVNQNGVNEVDINDGTLLARLAANESITGAWTFAPSATATAIAVTQAVGARGIVIAGGTQTTSQPILDLTQTWNAGAVTFQGIKLDVTNTASAAASRLLTLQVGAVEKFFVTPTGFGASGVATFAPGIATITGFLTVDPSGSGQALQVNGDGSATIAQFDDGTRTLVVTSYTGLDFAWGAITTDRQIIQGDVEWNAGGITFKGIRINVVNTASASGSRILQLEENSVSKFAVDASGFLYIAGTKVLGTRVTGYTAMTGTADRATAYATSTITLVQLAERVKAIQDDLTTHGAIGA